MTERARREYAEALRPHYAQADKRERGRMLDEYCRATGDASEGWPMASLPRYMGDDWLQVAQAAVIASVESRYSECTSLAACFSRVSSGLLRL